ncbi:MAG TPA: hypothetical protein VG010_10350 [Solirubrobacteraceae bacterium]|jgi:hypothetical protein|nr:hypothetical protein [Solirubrobacteraceae bacterium]
MGRCSWNSWESSSAQRVVVGVVGVGALGAVTVFVGAVTVVVWVGAVVVVRWITVVFTLVVGPTGPGFQGSVEDHSLARQQRVAHRPPASRPTRKAHPPRIGAARRCRRSEGGWGRLAILCGRSQIAHSSSPNSRHRG